MLLSGGFRPLPITVDAFTIQDAKRFVKYFRFFLIAYCFLMARQCTIWMRVGHDRSNDSRRVPCG